LYPSACSACQAFVLVIFETRLLVLMVLTPSLLQIIPQRIWLLVHLDNQLSLFSDKTC